MPLRPRRLRFMRDPYVVLTNSISEVRDSRFTREALNDVRRNRLRNALELDVAEVLGMRARRRAS